MRFRKLKHYFFIAIKNPKKVYVKVKEFAQGFYIYLKLNNQPTVINEMKSSSVINLQTFKKLPLITIFSRKKIAHDFYLEVKKYIGDNNRFVTQRGLALIIKNINSQVTELKFADLNPFIEKKFILVDIHTLHKIHKIASTNYHFFICFITNEQEKYEFLKYPKLHSYINILISIGCDINIEGNNIPLILNKKTVNEALASLEFIISSQINFEEALIPLKIPTKYDARLIDGTMDGLDAYFSLRKLDGSKSNSFKHYLEKNLNDENITQVYVNETIELMYLTIINFCRKFKNWTPLAERLLRDGYYIEINK